MADRNAPVRTAVAVGVVLLALRYVSFAYCAASASLARMTCASV
jgi:hypothetical protein